jgi:hypothetical protein
LSDDNVLAPARRSQNKTMRALVQSRVYMKVI